MRAAVVTAFDAPPRYLEFPDPVARSEDEVVVDVLAAGLHPRVLSQADGSHYTGTGELPLVPGIDAVVRDPQGRIRYTVLGDSTLGTMAEQTTIELDRSVILPDDTEPVVMAAAMNPVMSSWMALRHRIDFRRNQSVLVLGATGNAGRIAIQVAKRFGASKVIAAGRDQTRLESLGALGADETCTFEQLAAAAEVDVVLDYVWGKPAVQAIIDMLTARIDRSRNLTWIQIGSIAGPDAPIPSAALRQARLQIVGSGIGSVPGPDFIEEIPNIAAAVTGGAFDVRPRAVPLADVERTWTEALHSFDRIVLIP